MEKFLCEIIDDVPGDNNDKTYLICIRTDSDDYWEIVEGRKEAWDYIKDKCMYHNVNMDESFILVNTVNLDKRKPIYTFMKYSEDFINDPDAFDIDDYINNDESSENHEVINTIDESNSLDMENIMNGMYNAKELK